MTIPRNLSFLAQGASSTGVLGTANGGTNLTSFTVNGIPYASSSSVLATSTYLTWSGTTLKALTNANGANSIIEAATLDPYSRAFVYATGSYQTQTNQGGFGIRWNDGISTNTMFQVDAVNTGATASTTSSFVRFFNSVSGSLTEAMRISASGGVSIGNTTDPGAGNLRFSTAGTNGIYFGSSARLDDYQQGTWTPTLTDGTNSVNLTGGYYIKVGKLVTLFVNSYNTSMSGLNTASNLTITNLPFTPTQDSLVSWTPSLFVALTSFSLYLSASQNKIYVYRNATAVDYNGTPLSVFGSPANMSWFFSISYAA